MPREPMAPKAEKRRQPRGGRVREPAVRAGARPFRLAGGPAPPGRAGTTRQRTPRGPPGPGCGRRPPRSSRAPPTGAAGGGPRCACGPGRARGTRTRRRPRQRAGQGRGAAPAGRPTATAAARTGGRGGGEALENRARPRVRSGRPTAGETVAQPASSRHDPAQRAGLVAMPFAAKPEGPAPAAHSEMRWQHRHEAQASAARDDGPTRCPPCRDSRLDNAATERGSDA